MKHVIQFTRIRYIMILISILVIAAGTTATVMQGGFNLGIDFEAGLLQRVEIRGSGDVGADAVRDALSGIDGVQVQRVGRPEDNQFSIRVRDSGDVEDFSRVMTDEVVTALGGEFGERNIGVLETSYVGPRFSQDLATQAIWLTTLALLLILAYIWFRFRLGYAASAIVTLIHDVAVMLGFIGALQIEVSTATIAAVLTIIGYSLNDTIVVFDRIRENESILRESPLATIVNTSITQSLSRTLITSLTTLLAVLAIYLFATGQIRDFALNLVVGIVVGTYSSIFVASPILLAWRTRAIARRRKKELERYGGRAAPAETPKREALAPVDEKGNQPEPAAVGVDADAVKKEVAKKRQSTGAGRNVPRSKRKKKK
ncbi:MAG: protein translocase subunit SecF [Spirochaetaceae bacterium]